MNLTQEDQKNMTLQFVVTFVALVAAMYVANKWLL